jgi:hypothetical protein
MRPTPPNDLKEQDPQQKLARMIAATRQRVNALLNGIQKQLNDKNKRKLSH